MAHEGTHLALHPTRSWSAGPPQEGRERYHGPGAACDVCSGWLQAARVGDVACRPHSASSAVSCRAKPLLSTELMPCRCHLVWKPAESGRLRIQKEGGEGGTSPLSAPLIAHALSCATSAYPKPCCVSASTMPDCCDAAWMRSSSPPTLLESAGCPLQAALAASLRRALRRALLTSRPADGTCTA